MGRLVDEGSLCELHSVPWRNGKAVIVMRWRRGLTGMVCHDAVKGAEGGA